MLGHYHLNQAVKDVTADAHAMTSSALLIVRPRAWNMIERHLMIRGRPVPGALVDYGLFLFHKYDIPIVFSHHLTMKE